MYVLQSGLPQSGLPVKVHLVNYQKEDEKASPVGCYERSQHQKQQTEQYQH